MIAGNLKNRRRIMAPGRLSTRRPAVFPESLWAKRGLVAATKSGVSFLCWQ
ncbi:Uncharacterised protein [Cardiobacterium hominis]|uniref:Uncharacterized protein n=1 Tax=Cardiobacterium hominis (strain ATCC 15826 / DSM 8339 / NCTC 10426 / 6573) TaxID=638300 RepID=C8N9N5_CARH6|nr:hypothetical protein HMPREF0198_1213 [Cardiobacterium hominis ATCC 15826]VEG76265.1 Uncharacterised protein [Cardiobacterium hominis]